MERLSISVADAIDDFIADLEAQGRAVTARSYRHVLRPVARLDLPSIAALDARACREAMRERARALKDSSLVTFFAVLRSFCRWCVEQRYLVENPTDGLSKPKQRRPAHRYVSPDVLRKMFGLARDDADRLILLLCGGSGLRSGELRGLRWRDIDFERGTIRVLGKGRKWRELAPGAAAIGLLRRHRASVAGEHVLHLGSSSGLRHRVRNMATAAGAGAVTVHMLRHSFAIAFLEASGEDGMTLQELLGHANPIMTQYYIRDVRSAAALRKQRSVDLAGKIFGD